MEDNFTIYQSGSSGTTTAVQNGTPQARLNSPEKARRYGSFDSLAAARKQAAELLISDPYAVFLVCDADYYVLEWVSDCAKQDELRTRHYRGDRVARCLIVLVSSLLCGVLFWKLLPVSLGIASALAALVFVVFFVLTWASNPVETAFVVVVISILVSLAIPSIRGVMKRAQLSRSSMLQDLRTERGGYRLESFILRLN